MHELPAEVFDKARGFLPANFSWECIAPWGERAPLAGLIIARAPVAAEPDGRFSLWCRRLLPPPSWVRQRWIIAIRCGAVPSETTNWPDFYGCGDEVAAIAARRWQVLAQRWETDLPPALFGRHVLDLVTVADDAALRPLATLRGDGIALGTLPARQDNARVRVHKGALTWLRERCAGIVPLGALVERQATLLQCRGGVIADDVNHARDLRRLMRRPRDDVPTVWFPRQADAEG